MVSTTSPSACPTMKNDPPGWPWRTLIQVNGEGRRWVETVAQTPPNRKRAMTPAEYAKAYLSNRRKDLATRLESVERSLRRETFAPSKDAEDHAVEFDDEVLDRLADITRIELSRLDHAIR